MARVDKCYFCMKIVSPMFAPEEMVYVEVDKKNNISEVAICIGCAEEKGIDIE